MYAEEKLEVVCVAFFIALILTVISFFNGGVRYSDGVTEFPPIALQLLRNFAVYFVVFCPAYYLIRRLTRRKNK